MSSGVCPDYRLRLFLSVDLVGSTAYKNNVPPLPSDDGSHEGWIAIIRDFYRSFPSRVSNGFSVHTSSSGRLGDPPKVWKTIGDEILFCNRVIDIEHLARSVEAFLAALKNYGTVLETSGGALDVKGAGWIAAFPVPNLTVSLADASVSADQFDELFEEGADKDPRSVDFLGNAIDCGFRIARFAAADRFAVSAELGWLLAEAADLKHFKQEFGYDGRQPLRGVLRDRPYPIVWIDVERSASRRRTRAREQKLHNRQAPTPLDVKDFLLSFLGDEKIDKPCLISESNDIPKAPPASYDEYCMRWNLTREELFKRGIAEGSSDEHDDSIDAMPPDVLSVMDALPDTRDPSDIEVDEH